LLWVGFPSEQPIAGESETELFITAPGLSSLSSSESIKNLHEDDVTQYRNEPPDFEEDDFDDLDKEFIFSLLLSLSGLCLVVAIACVAAWFLVN
jgi:hypothetical protein